VIWADEVLVKEEFVGDYHVVHESLVGEVIKQNEFDVDDALGQAIL
jgi:hypothetical protein